jgi:hypothetical protein
MNASQYRNETASLEQNVCARFGLTPFESHIVWFVANADYCLSIRTLATYVAHWLSLPSCKEDPVLNADQAIAECMEKGWLTIVTREVRDAIMDNVRGLHPADPANVVPPAGALDVSPPKVELLREWWKERHQLWKRYSLSAGRRAPSQPACSVIMRRKAALSFETYEEARRFVKKAAEYFVFDGLLLARNPVLESVGAFPGCIVEVDLRRPDSLQEALDACPTLERQLMPSLPSQEVYQEVTPESDPIVAIVAGNDEIGDLPSASARETTGEPGNDDAMPLHEQEKGTVIRYYFADEDSLSQFPDYMNLQYGISISIGEAVQIGPWCIQWWRSYLKGFYMDVHAPSPWLTE